MACPTCRTPPPKTEIIQQVRHRKLYGSTTARITLLYGRTSRYMILLTIIMSHYFTICIYLLSKHSFRHCMCSWACHSQGMKCCGLSDTLNIHILRWWNHPISLILKCSRIHNYQSCFSTWKSSEVQYISLCAQCCQCCGLPSELDYFEIACHELKNCWAGGLNLDYFSSVYPWQLFVLEICHFPVNTESFWPFRVQEHSFYQIKHPGEQSILITHFMCKSTILIFF